jgi:hypothetical protein
MLDSSPRPAASAGPPLPGQSTGVFTTARPTVAAAARRGMACGEPAINRWYEAVELEPPLDALVAFLDGTRTEQQLVDALAATARAGDVFVHDEHGHPIDDPAVLAATFATFVPEALAGLAQVGLLVA